MLSFQVFNFLLIHDKGTSHVFLSLSRRQHGLRTIEAFPSEYSRAYGQSRNLSYPSCQPFRLVVAPPEPSPECQGHRHETVYILKEPFSAQFLRHQSAHIPSKRLVVLVFEGMHYPPHRCRLTVREVCRHLIYMCPSCASPETSCQHVLLWFSP